ncbi:unnamed protein product [Cuscuta campestris]|uniref:Replication factor A C-terminal domain-containing protein n=1 Tax=Cuscuta campestris TaxID=132261 RepID=A0A484KZU2_9ASTE|nr:unnamed protein product [Cuscuta campestris]
MVQCTTVRTAQVVFSRSPRDILSSCLLKMILEQPHFLFDREASNILNISCAELMEKSDLAGSFENPKEFDDLLLGKTYIFKVEDGEYAVYGTIKGVDGGADWFIPTCRCGSEVIPRNGFYYCSDCKKCVVNVIPRYRIKARVNDASDSATFVIFESLGCLLLHKSCSEMRKFCEGLPVGCEQPDVFKQMLLEKSFIFKVEVKTANINDFEPSYNVNDLCFNDRIIAKFMEMHSSFFSPQTDKTLGYSTDGKTNTEVISVGNASSCVKVLKSKT